jgi:predicted RNA-binding protein with TRAM domain
MRGYSDRGGHSRDRDSDRGESRGYGGGGRGGGGDYGGDRGGSGGGSFEKPVKEGQEYDIVIESVGSRGDGVGKVNNFVVFVPGARQGDRMKIRISRVFNRFAVGERSGEASTAPAATESEEAPSDNSGDDTGEEGA